MGVVGVGYSRGADKAFDNAKIYDRAARNYPTTSGMATYSKAEGNAKEIGHSLSAVSFGIDGVKFGVDLKGMMGNNTDNEEKKPQPPPPPKPKSDD